MKNLLFDFLYLVKNKKEWLIAIVICIAVMLYLFFTGKQDISWFNNIGSYLQSISAFATLFIAASVLREERLKNLDKKLTVIFKFKNQPVIRCEKAYLAGTSDIRQWGQSIGQLMNDGERLHFEPFIEEEDAVETDKGSQYRHYTVTFTLEKLPEKFREAYNKGQYLAWYCSNKMDSEYRAHPPLSAPKAVTNVPSETPQ